MRKGDIQPKLVAEGVTQQTHNRRRCALNHMVAWFRDNPDMCDLPLGQSLAVMMEQQGENLGWCWATLFRNMTNLTGALNYLNLYVETANGVPVFRGINIESEAMWRLALMRAKRGANAEEARVPVSMTSEHAALLLTRPLVEAVGEEDLQLRGLLLLSWCCGARVGDVLQLRQHHVWRDHKDPERLHVTFRNGKVAGRYPVHAMAIVVPLELQRLLPWLDTPRPASSPFIFQMSNFGKERAQWLTKLRTLMRTVCQRYEARSLRRGRIHQLADQCIPREVLMRFTGHRSEDTAVRYLNNGTKDRYSSDVLAAAQRRAAGSSVAAQWTA